MTVVHFHAGRCSRCSGDAVVVDAYCATCGARLPASRSRPGPDAVPVCERCSLRPRTEWLHCTGCGALLHEEPPARPRVPYPPQKPGPSPTRGETALALAFLAAMVCLPLGYVALIAFHPPHGTGEWIRVAWVGAAIVGMLAAAYRTRATVRKALAGARTMKPASRSGPG